MSLFFYILPKTFAENFQNVTLQLCEVVNVSNEKGMLDWKLWCANVMKSGAGESKKRRRQDKAIREKHKRLQ